LAVLLQDCGTGVSQVLAMLYIVITSKEPKTIIIDEPQSFLHPGAVRKLLEIFQKHPEHQYILATHSPALVTGLKLSSLVLVKRQGAESTLENLDPTEPRKVRDVLNEVGAQISDIYGADSVLWVEGETEEICFKLVAQKFKINLSGTVILAVQHTGDFEAKDKKKVETVFNIYATLGLSKAILPPALGFVFDLERRKPDEIREWKNRGDNASTPVRFLERTLFENYLLIPQAICVVINNYDNVVREKPITIEDISTWIDKNRWEAKYFEPPFSEADKIADQQKGFLLWAQRVHGAKLLKDLFASLTENRVEFQKVTRDAQHSVELTEWLLEHQPQELEEIRSLLQKFFPIS
jgi:energy-coupling factor transporter ATP-binding protein EcfA2